MANQLQTLSNALLGGAPVSFKIEKLHNFQVSPGDWGSCNEINFIARNRVPGFRACNFQPLGCGRSASSNGRTEPHEIRFRTYQSSEHLFEIYPQDFARS